MAGGLYQQALKTELERAGYAVETELVFSPPRRFRFDLAIPAINLAIEIEGATWVRGGHSTGAGIDRDCTKGNLAVARGWRCLRYTTSQLRDRFGECLEQILEVAKCSGSNQPSTTSLP